MRQVLSLLREHRHFVIITTLLTLVMTFPTVAYIFRTDVFWLPTGDILDVYIKLWDVWYGNQILTGQADRFYTDLIYYPEGVSLANHPLFQLHSFVVTALQLFMPLSNAYSLTHLLIIFSSACAAYLYLFWLLEDKWLSIFGAVVFGISPQVMAHAHWPEIAWIAPMPLVIYSFHRGVRERRMRLIILAGLLTGLTTEVTMYFYVIVVIALGICVFALSTSRWREKAFWLQTALLIAVVALSSTYRLIPMLENREALSTAMAYYGQEERKNDLVSFVVNPGNPILGPLSDTILHITTDISISKISYVGFLPLALLSIGLFNKGTRRKMLPWLGLCLVFVVLHLGSNLTVNGTAFESIRLPKHYLDRLLPFIFQAYHRTNHFMAGVSLPLAILACYGLVALQRRLPAFSQPGVITVLIILVAIEYYIPIPNAARNPIRDDPVSGERFVYIDWLDQERDDDIRLINLPMGRKNAKLYLYLQTLSGYPQTEGGISRPPDSAYNFIKANHLLNAWYNEYPINCEIADRDTYLSGLNQLEEDGFTHIVYYRDFEDWEKIFDSFRNVQPAYSDDFVSIYRLSDLPDSCPEDFSIRHPFTRVYADALQKSSIIDERHGTIVIFPPTLQVSDHFNWYLRQFASIDKTVMTITTGMHTTIDIQSSESSSVDPQTAVEIPSAVWLVNDRQGFNAEQTEAYQEWFMERFKYCARFHEDDDTAIDLYLRSSIPCSAMDTSSALGVRYDGGVRLHNLSYDVSADAVRVFLSWTNDTNNNYSFSIQFFDEDGQKTLQYDNVIYRDLLEVREIDISSLPDGMNTVKLIVYDFETRVSRGGTVSDTAERFERELEVAKIEVDR